MKIRTVSILLLALIAGTSIFAQGSKTKPVISNYSLKFKVGGLKDVDVYLGFHYGEKKFIKDTAHVNANGEVEFTGKDTLQGGIYLFVTPRKNFFEFVVNESKIQMETDTLDMVGHMVIKKSAENTIWYSYMKTIAEKQKLIEPLKAKMKDLPKDGKEYKDAEAEIKKHTDEINKFRDDQIRKNPDMLVSKIFKAMKDIDLPIAKTKADSATLPAYFKAHFWDNIDLTDNRLIRTPILEAKIVYYFDKIIYQIPDSAIAACDWILAKSASEPEMFKFVCHHLTYAYERSQIMCMDAVFVHLIDTYYKTGKATWVDQKTMDKMLERADKLRPILCNKTVEDIILPDTSGTKWHALYDLKGDYTVLYFWDATCSHCKKSTPVLIELYNDFLKPNGIEIFGVEGELEDAEWKKYTKEHNLPWVNVSDNPEINTHPERYILQEKKTTLNSLNFRHIFDLYSYPVVYILDKDKKIIAKKLGVEQIKEFIEKYRKSKSGKQDQ
jgi:peroxiredoxin